jgi:hypothetical protein
MKSRYDRLLRGEEFTFEIGDLVKLRNHRQTKFQFPWIGPFKIVDYGPNKTYYLIKPDGQRLDYLVNHDYLAFYNIKDPEYYYDGKALTTS